MTMHKARPRDPAEPPEREHDAALIFAEDADRGDEQHKNEEGEKNEKVDIVFMAIPNPLLSANAFLLLTGQ